MSSIIQYYFGLFFFFNATENKMLDLRYDYFVFFKVNTRSYTPAAFQNPRESNSKFGLHIQFLIVSASYEVISKLDSTRSLSPSPGNMLLISLF